MWRTISRKDALNMVGKGWSEIINSLYNKKPRKTKVVQVKEKFGTLRFYVDSSTDEFDKLIEEAEDKSSTICEYCGEPGYLRDLSWILTLCDKCYERLKED